MRLDFVRRALLAFVLLATALPAQAAVTVTFYSREFGERFPHAFVELGGTMDQDGTPVSGRWGFTPRVLSPAILMGPVPGMVEAVTDGYKARSKAHFTVTITDDQYRAVFAVIEDWRTRPGRSYKLNTANCVHFVGEIARAAGLTVVNDPKLMKKPTSYLIDVMRQNPQLEGAGKETVAG